MIPLRGRVLSAVFVVLSLASAAPADEISPAAVSPLEEGLPVLTLPDAVARAMSEGYDARIAQLETGRAVDDHAAARSVYYPKLAVTSNAGWSNRLGERLKTTNPSGESKRYGLVNLGSTDGWLNVEVEQVVFDLRRWREVKQEELAAELARMRESQRREGIAFEVTQRYAQLLRIERLGVLSLERHEQAQWLEEQGGLLFDAGRELASEREAAVLHLEETRIEASIRREEAREARALLWLAMGGAEGVAAFTVDPASVPLPPQLDVDPEAVSTAPELRALELERQIEETRVSAARASRYPTLNLYTGYAHYGVNRYDNFEDEFLVGVDFRVPIFDGFEGRNEVRGAVKSAEIARLRYQSLLRTKRARVKEVSRQFASATDRAGLIEKLADTAREQQRLADVRLQSGRGTLGDSRRARERYGRLRLEAIDARYRRIELWAGLQREVGRLVAAIGPSIVP